jgi:hypothetical protein
MRVGRLGANAESLVIMRVESYETIVAWRDGIAEFPADCRDIYFTPEYHDLQVRNGDGTGYCVAVSEGARRLLIPGLRIPIAEREGATRAKRYYDIQSCNGYGGPIASGDTTSEFLELAWEKWRNLSIKEGIVAAFFRLHPLLDNARWLPADARVVLDRQTVAVDISDGLQAAWQRADSRHRNMVNKGKREGVRVSWEDPRGWEDFESLYKDSMERLESPASLRFSRAYFAALREVPGVTLACIRAGTELVAGSVFMFGPVWGHYHLSARRAGANNCLTNCMLQAALERAATAGLKSLHLGGGRTCSSEDGLLRFKKSLGTELLDFKVALVVANEDIYEAMCSTWTEKTDAKPRWLLGYRQPNPPLSGIN